MKMKRSSLPECKTVTAAFIENKPVIQIYLARVDVETEQNTTVMVVDKTINKLRRKKELSTFEVVHTNIFNDSVLFPFMNSNTSDI
jgi:hypothetical protein